MLPTKNPEEPEKSPLNEAFRGLVWVAASANRVATVYTSAPNRRREPIFADLCTLLHPHGCPQQRNSVHKCPMTQPATHGKPHSGGVTLTENRTLRRRRHLDVTKGAFWTGDVTEKRISPYCSRTICPWRRRQRWLPRLWVPACRSSPVGKRPRLGPGCTPGRMNAPGHTLDASYGSYVLYAIYASYVPYAYGLRDILPSDWGMVR